MRLASGTVLGLAAVATSPAIVALVNGDLSVDVALTRYLITVIIVWAALSALVALVGDVPRRTIQQPPPLAVRDEPVGPQD